MCVCVCVCSASALVFAITASIFPHTRIAVKKNKWGVRSLSKMERANERTNERNKVRIFGISVRFNRCEMYTDSHTCTHTTFFYFLCFFHTLFSIPFRNLRHKSWRQYAQHMYVCECLRIAVYLYLGAHNFMYALRRNFWQSIAAFYICVCVCA